MVVQTSAHVCKHLWQQSIYVSAQRTCRQAAVGLLCVRVRLCPRCSCIWACFLWHRGARCLTMCSWCLCCGACPSQQEGPLRLSQVLRIAVEVSRGMDYLHQRKIIHRDLKAANLLMDDHGIVKVRLG